jgi:(E)-4-hydroxy-3-methylbut-2-enyl-diphosphate synthase
MFVCKYAMEKKQFCNDLFSYSRFITREVNIGNVAMGGHHPIRIQSMTTTDTMDTKATVEQSIRMIESGCDYVRITAPSLNEARNLELIKKELRARGYQTPLIADIHFTPNAAELAARLVEKVRVNPGNYADKKKFDLIEYSDSDYQEELDRIRERFTPLVKICKEYGTAMRIGTNHGSLSDRILSRYGDTPLGMVESAMEFLRICEDHHYHNIVLSMKASNPKVMVEAYRLLVATMMQNNMNYPLHLGVTEAGDGEDGRIKSAAGIGTLLEDGLGDTVRVSLTEDPEFEAPVAIALVNRYLNRKQALPVDPPSQEAIALYSPFEFSKRESRAVSNFGKDQVPRVIADFSEREEINQASFFALGYHYAVALDKWNLSDMACDYVYLGNKDISFEIPGTLGLIYNHQTWHTLAEKKQRYPLFCGDEYFRTMYKSKELNFVAIDYSVLSAEFLSKITNDETLVLILDTFHEHGVAEQRAAFMKIVASGCKAPVIIKRNYRSLSDELLQLYASTDFASLLMDGYGNGTWIKTIDCGSPMLNNRLAFGVLQASRTRISKTEYISCPSCGRTLFDLQETTARIRKRTQHLKGVKIGIMGCIVNGPGEMADADYGYVGVGVGKITLYKGKEVVRKNIATEEAVDALIDLIKEHGDWVEEPVLVGE